MEKKKAIQRIQKQIDCIDSLKSLRRNSPDFKKWKRDTEVSIENIFGESKRHIKDFNSIYYSLGVISRNTSEREYQAAYVRGLDNATAILESFVDEINEYWKVEKPLEQPSQSTIKQTGEIKLPFNLKLIWDAINKDFDITKRSFGKKISFITEDFKRKIIFRDIAHAYCLAQNNFSKPAVILSGSVIEELLRMYLIHKGVTVNSTQFRDYIKACEDNGLLKSAIRKLSDSIRYFRNLVHLKEEIDSRHSISKPTAIGAVSSIFTISNDFE